MVGCHESFRLVPLTSSSRVLGQPEPTLHQDRKLLIYKPSDLFWWCAGILLRDRSDEVRNRLEVTVFENAGIVVAVRERFEDLVWCL